MLADSSAALCCSDDVGSVPAARIPIPNKGTPVPAYNSIPSRGRAPARRALRPSATSRREADPPRADVTSPEFRRSHRLSGRVRATIAFDGVRYLLRPHASLVQGEAAAFALLPDGALAAIDVAEMIHPAEGCLDPAAAGLICSCVDYSPAVACRHLRALAALGILRVAPEASEVWTLTDLADGVEE